MDDKLFKEAKNKTELYEIRIKLKDGRKRTLTVLTDCEQPYPRTAWEWRTRGRMVALCWKQLESGKWVWRRDKKYPKEGPKWPETLGSPDTRSFKVFRIWPDGDHCCVYESPKASPRVVKPQVLKCWDARFIALAQHIAQWSKDPSTKVGCVVVGPDREIRSTGFNGFPRGVKDDDRLDNRETKYPLICHAEENAIMHAARIGVSLKGCTAYVTWPPCTRCARSLVQAGLTRVVVPNVDVPDRWKDDFKMSMALLVEAGLVVSFVP